MKAGQIVRTSLIVLGAWSGCASVQAAEPSNRFIVTDTSPARAQLPFSDAVRAGHTLYVAGTIGLDPATSQVPSDAKAEAKLVMDAIQRTLEAAGYKLEDLVSVQVFCTNLELYASFNEVYRGYFHEHFPARAFVGVNALVRGAHFEVKGTAVKGPPG
jgi:2-iminobutanoate/2-iminopropanoate deaminase